jgi:hypothetical protein
MNTALYRYSQGFVVIINIPAYDQMLILFVYTASTREFMLETSTFHGGSNHEASLRARQGPNLLS